MTRDNFELTLKTIKNTDWKEKLGVTLYENDCECAIGLIVFTDEYDDHYKYNTVFPTNTFKENALKYLKKYQKENGIEEIRNIKVFLVVKDMFSSRWTDDEVDYLYQTFS